MHFNCKGGIPAQIKIDSILSNFGGKKNLVSVFKQENVYGGKIFQPLELLEKHFEWMLLRSLNSPEGDRQVMIH